MLPVPTFQVRHPVLSFILMKTNDLALHGSLVYSCLLSTDGHSQLAQQPLTAIAVSLIERPAELVYRIGFNPLHARVRGGR